MRPTILGRLDAVLDRLLNAAIGAYFELSYRLLDSDAGRAFLRQAAEPGGPIVHGYAASDDIRVLVESLAVSAESTVFDLGSGPGGTAILVHRQSGADVIGVERSRRAVAAARRRAAAAGVDAHVRFVQGDLADPPGSASAAYALDSLMFVRHPLQAMAVLTGRLQPPARMFATVVVLGRSDSESLRRSIEGLGIRLIRLDDVTAALASRSGLRRTTAARLLRDGPVPGLLPLALVWVEETGMGMLVRAGLARRWRVVVEKPTSRTS